MLSARELASSARSHGRPVQASRLHRRAESRAGAASPPLLGAIDGPDGTPHAPAVRRKLATFSPPPVGSLTTTVIASAMRAPCALWPRRVTMRLLACVESDFMLVPRRRKAK